MVELEWLRFAKKKGRRKSDKSLNEKIKIKKIGDDIVIESEHNFYRISLSKIIEVIEEK